MQAFKVKSDVENETPGKRIRHWISRGVPLVLTVQLAEGQPSVGGGWFDVFLMVNLMMKQEDEE